MKVAHGRDFVLKPGALARLDLRMNWPGTGSVQGGEIMKDKRAGAYQWRLVLLTGADKQRTYLASPKFDVRVEIG